ncbi:MAG: hypothetical protein IPH55_06560 [Betaproteobacteria bacterium]|nr:hypothetical protein [Betaproteobacteria bacterium]
MDTIKEATLRELAEAQSIRSAIVLGRPGGYAISVRYGMTERALATSRGGLRLFTLDAASRFLRELGLSRFEVDVSGYEPGRIRKARPDRASALALTRRQPSLL